MNKLLRRLANLSHRAQPLVAEEKLESEPARQQSSIAVSEAPPSSVAITAEKIREGRLFATRQDMVHAVVPAPASFVCEVGVAYGDFSKFLISALRPEYFAAVDTFELHKLDILWGQPTASVFEGKTHRRFYEDRIGSAVQNLLLLEGRSNQVLWSLPDSACDLIYVDAAHDYESVKGDIAAAVWKIKSDGVLIFNDYSFGDPFLKGRFGVVRAVNELIMSSDWRVVGLSLDPFMFCDIALRRF